MRISISEQTHSKIYFYSLLFAFSTVVWGKMFITLSTIILLLHFFVEGNLKSKFHDIKSNKGVILFFTLFFIQFVGLLHSENIVKGLNMSLSTLPLLVFPMVMASKKALSCTQYKILLFAFLFSLLINSFYCIGYFHFFMPEYTDVREISRFMSHIRYSLYLNIAIGISAYFILYKKSILSKNEVIFLSISIVWFCFFLIVMHTLSGLAILFTLFVYISIVIIKKYTNKSVKLLGIVGVISLCTVSSIIIWNELKYFLYPDVVDETTLEINTPRGVPYLPFYASDMIENGHQVNQYLCPYEVMQGWAERSKIPFDSLDNRSQAIEYTAYRYLTSLNLRKDYDGVMSLSDKDIQNIEAGIANHRLVNKYSISSRIYETLWEIDRYKKGALSNFHSFTQRFIFVDCAISVIKQNLWFGTGTSDFKHEMNILYQSEKNNLPKELWLMPHNHYLTLTGRYGIVGMLLIILGIFYSLSNKIKQNTFLITVWIIVCFLSMLVEDTLENYNGLALFSYFGALFVCSKIDFYNNQLYV